jgi:outer membrane translocation and assembly module TamA
VGAGFGLRYKSPVGPIRVDLGFKLGTLQMLGLQREHRVALHVSIGQAF